MTGSSPPRKPATRLDVAREAGVSLVTASLALNDHPRVAVATRARVQEAARKLGFVANAAARRLALGGGFRFARPFEQVALLYLQEANISGEQTFLTLVSGIEAELATRGACLLLVRVVGEAGWNNVDRLARTGSVDGFLLLGRVDEHAVDRVSRTRIPAVVLGAHAATSPIHSVDIDYRMVGRHAAEHLHALGHRRVAYAGGSMRHQYQHQILAGFKEAARRLRLQSDATLFTRVTSAVEAETPRDESAMQINYGLERARHWTQAVNPPPTAVFTAELGWGLDLCRGFQQLGIAVPSNVSVLGMESAVAGRPGLQTSHVQLPLAEVGRQGALQLQRLARDESLDPGQLRIAPTIVEGWSAAVCASP